MRPIQWWRDGVTGARGSVLAIIAALAGTLVPPAAAQDASEAEVKAAIVLNIARFTQWPAGAAADPAFTVCVAGRDETTQAIETLEGKTLHGHPMRVVPFERVGALSECRVLFVARTETYRSSQLAALLVANRHPVLTIGDIRGFAQRGGMVALVRVDDRLRFEINPKEVEVRGLTMSSRLLSLALLVR